MSFLRALSASLLAAAASFSLVTASGCGTSAVGVDACRDIEQARCRAGQHCGLISDVAACERYYRDHCLHGLATAPPARALVNACVQAIEAAGACAAEDPEASLSDCDPESAIPAPQTGLRTACDVVRNPERASECAFLTDTPPPEGSGGQGGAGGEEATEELEPTAGQGGAPAR